jgi:sphinganine-1-phosphate aldolase
VGRSKDDVLAALKQFKSHDARWREGRVWAGVYDAGSEVEAVAKSAYTEFLNENALYINMFPSVLALETEVVNWVKQLLRAPAEARGNFTSGGTESITLAMKAARDSAAPKLGDARGEVIICRTTHPAFHKAAHLLGMKVIITEMTASFQADVAAYERAITPHTVMLVGSAPCYSHGVIDPTEALSNLAQKHKLWLHVDACVGGIFLSTMRKIGMAVPTFDFTYEGVSSMSADLHKYGYTAKNASTVIFRSAALRRHALYANAHTTGYALVNSTIASSRSSGPIAAAWATIQTLGDDGYQRIVQGTMAATTRLREGVNAIDGLRVMAEPIMCMFTMQCDVASVFVIEDEMLARGWHVQTQFQAPGTPANLHLSINQSNVAHVEAFLADLKSSVEAARQAPTIDVQPLVAMVMQALQDPQSMDLNALMSQLGGGAGKMPERWAMINTLLDALPDAVVDELLLEYANGLYA